MGETDAEARRLIDEAIDLVIRLQSDPGNPVARDMAHFWRRRSPAHEAAFARVAAIHGLAGEWGKVRLASRTPARRRPTRRALLLGGASVPVAAAAALVLPGMILTARADHTTGKGETARVGLSDGSVVNLGPASALRLRFNERERGVELLAGIAFFEVRPETARRFTLAADSLRIAALGTAFNVSIDAGLLSVEVGRGTVEAWADTSDGVGASERFDAGEWLSYDPVRGQLARRGSIAPDRIATWCRGVLVADEEPVAVLIERIGRWVPGRVVVANPAIGPQRVSGVFDLRKPHEALEAALYPVGARVWSIPGGVTIIT